MKICKPKYNLKCDTVSCGLPATIQIETSSYKGNILLCDSCFKKLQNLFKRKSSDETKKQK